MCQESKKIKNEENRVKHCLKKIKNIWIWLRLSFKEQFRKQWVTILIDVFIAGTVFYFGILFTLSLHNEDVRQRTAPLFKYIYNQSSETISVDSGGDFSPVSTVWMIPRISTTTPFVFSKGNLSIEEDIIKNIFLESNYLIKKFGNSNSIEGDFVTYFKCIILNQFGLETIKTNKLEGFPVGVEIKYVVRGDTEIKTNYDLILLRSFDTDSLQIHPFPNLDKFKLEKFLLEGNYRFKKIIERNSYDKNNTYANEDGTCIQTTKLFLENPFK